MHFEVSRLLKADPGTVFAAYTDFEATPSWSKHIRAVRVTKREGDTVFTETEAISSKGKERKTAGPVRLIPPSRVESEGETRFTRTRRTVTFEAAEGGTKVTASLDIEMKGMWGFLLRPSANKENAEAYAQEELDSFAEFVEGTPAKAEGPEAARGPP